MKITPSIDLATGKATPASPSGPRAVGAGKADASSDSGSASIHLSELSTQLQALESSLAAGDEFDAAKVDEIKTAIRDGTLTVSAPVVADRMLAAVKDMLTSKGRG